jgi:hypothetical protein
MAVNKKIAAAKSVAKKKLQSRKVKSADISHISYISDGKPVTSNPGSFTVRITTTVPAPTTKKGKKK